MQTIQTTVLAIVQGLTELLPISSTGHMLLVSEVFFKSKPDLFTLTLLQFGTTISIIIYFRKLLFENLFSKKKMILYSKIVVASIPAVIAALLLEAYIEKYFYSELIIAVSLIVWGIFFVIVERVVKKARTNEIQDISFKQAIVMGFAQIFAIIPGTSRSGSTTVAGILFGIEKYTAIQFSFIMGIPILLGSFGYEVFKSPQNLSLVFGFQSIIGLVISAVVGYISIIILSKISKKNFLTIFGIYRIIIGILILLLFR